MAESLTLLTCVDEGLRRGVQRAQEDAVTSRRHASTYETFQAEDAGSGDRRNEKEEDTTVGCSPGALFRRLGWMLTGREKDDESLPLTERRKLSTPTCRLQVMRYLPEVIRYLALGSARQVKKAGSWLVVGLRDYATHGGFTYPIDVHVSPSTSQAAFWVSVL
ncbi:uncharacterized protein LOC126999508 [Eriocheir sinensis]|uniref:uncharacterized protein LOC126999508 n=1 Tax=Eriocheir sinensis TaxID=95602 RepID=UPI0021C84B72|nr:uncharacterized protein LOC126999508 [Eriocheir sinensis]